MVSDIAQHEEYPVLSTGDQVLSSQSFLSVCRTSRQCTCSHLPWVSLPADVSCPSCLSSVDFRSHTCLCFIREGLRCTVCSDSCSNSHTCFQRADVFSGASHAYFPQGDAFRHGPELELKWPFIRNRSLETWEVELQNTPWADTDRVVFVRVCRYRTAASCDNRSQMFKSSSAVMLVILLHMAQNWLVQHVKMHCNENNLFFQLSHFQFVLIAHNRSLTKPSVYSLVTSCHARNWPDGHSVVVFAVCGF